MSISPGYTDDEVRDFVYEYERQPWGTKRKWLDAQRIGIGTFRRWRRTVFDGDLDTGLIPREDGGMKTPGPSRREHVVLDAAKSRRIAELEKQIADLQNANSKLEASNDALGKAIGLLHELNAQEPDDDQEQKKPSDS